MRHLLIIAFGGVLGTLARYGLAGFVQQRVGSLFPWGTLCVNIIGCFVIGVIMTLVQDTPALRPEVRQFMAIGFLGAFTTFSTFGYESLALLHDGQRWLAMVNILVSVVLGLAAVEAGRVLVRWFLTA